MNSRAPTFPPIPHDGSSNIVIREILLSFWKVHILHHAAEKPIYGQWIAVELRRHGYHINPGTLYPLLKRMEGHGWLKCVPVHKSHTKSRREYRLTSEGARILSLICELVQELYQEVVKEGAGRYHR